MNQLHESALRMDREDSVLLLLVTIVVLSVISYIRSKKGRYLI